MEKSMESETSTDEDDATLPTELLALILHKAEATKKDLEKNWLYQTISVGLSLGLIVGLGDVVSRKLFDAPGHETALCWLLPFVNLYLFMRFGALATAFSRARFAAQNLTSRYFEQNPMQGLYSSLPEDIRSNGSLYPGVWYETNSYFEYFHQTTSGKVSTIGVFIYSLFVPVLFAVNHCISMYLLLAIFGHTTRGYFIIAIYSLPVVGLYIAYYMTNRGKNRRPNFILLSYAVTALLCIVFLFWTVRRNPDMPLFFNVDAIAPK
jgi:hypothetical protein